MITFSSYIPQKSLGRQVNGNRIVNSGIFCPHRVILFISISYFYKKKSICTVKYPRT